MYEDDGKIRIPFVRDGEALGLLRDVISIIGHLCGRSYTVLERLDPSNNNGAAVTLRLGEHEP